MSDPRDSINEIVTLPDEVESDGEVSDEDEEEEE